jgi:hypothetical protein
MATYRQMQDWVGANFGFTPKTCWIAHLKELCGVRPRRAPNRSAGVRRANPCPPERIEPIKEALRHFEMI